MSVWNSALAEMHYSSSNIMMLAKHQESCVGEKTQLMSSGYSGMVFGLRCEVLEESEAAGKTWRRNSVSWLSSVLFGSAFQNVFLSTPKASCFLHYVVHMLTTTDLSLYTLWFPVESSEFS